MKNSIIKAVFILMVSGCAVNASAADRGVNVPKQVSAAFAAKYPQANLKDWKTAKAGYIAEFKFNHHQFTATYAADGTWLKSEEQLSLASAPTAIKTALRHGKYASFYVDEVKLTDSQDGIAYILTIDNHNGTTLATEGYGSWEDYQVTYDINGKLTAFKSL